MHIIIIDRGKKIPAKNYGGTERVIWGLGYELTKLGHKVSFLVPEGSHCDFANVLFYNPAISINQQLPNDVDIAHINFPFNEELEIPYIVTMHGNVDKTTKLSKNSVFISRNMASRYHSTIYVYNGLLWSDYPTINLDLPRSYFHFLGKASWKVKNLSGTVEIALQTNNKLKVIGGNRWSFRSFRRQGFKLFNPNIQYCGMMNNFEKINIMQQSKGLIFPVTWDEPFGLAIIESMYAGCPVFASKRGSLPELISDEVGFVSDDIQELVDAINKKTYFSPQTCHNYAVRNFNSKVMTENYLKLYEKIINGETLHAVAPYAD